MWSYNYLPCFEETELYHHGIKGQKWGVRRTPEQLERARELRNDRRTTKTLKRHLAADKKNLRDRGQLVNESERAHREAQEGLRKELARPSFSRKKKLERVNEATEKVESTRPARERAKAELLRAERIYDADEKALIDHVNGMITKYGSDFVKGLSKKNIDLGNYYTKEVLKTGITVADMPIIGTWYSANYTSRRDYEDRLERLDEAASKR